MTEHNWQKNFSVNLCEAFPWATPELQWVTWFKFLTFCNNFLFSKALIPEKGLVTWLILACEQAHPRTHAPGNGIPCLRLKTLKHISAHIRSVHIWRIAPRGKCNKLQFSLGSGSIVRERNSAKKIFKNLQFISKWAYNGPKHHRWTKTNNKQLIYLLRCHSIAGK